MVARNGIEIERGMTSREAVEDGLYNSLRMLLRDKKYEEDVCRETRRFTMYFTLE